MLAPHQRAYPTVAAHVAIAREITDSIVVIAADAYRMVADGKSVWLFLPGKRILATESDDVDEWVERARRSGLRMYRQRVEGLS